MIQGGDPEGTGMAVRVSGENHLKNEIHQAFTIFAVLFLWQMQGKH